MRLARKVVYDLFNSHAAEPVVSADAGIPSRLLAVSLGPARLQSALDANAYRIQMKHKTDPFLAVLTLVLSLLLTISLAACSAGSKPPQTSAALEKARKFKLSDVKFDGLPLEVVITTLQDESAHRDPARKGVTISLGPDAKQFADTEINLQLKEVTLAETLGRIADSVGLEVQANDSELLLVQKKGKQ